MEATICGRFYVQQQKLFEQTRYTILQMLTLVRSSNRLNMQILQWNGGDYDLGSRCSPIPGGLGMREMQLCLNCTLLSNLVLDNLLLLLIRYMYICLIPRPRLGPGNEATCIMYLLLARNEHRRWLLSSIHFLSGYKAEVLCTHSVIILTPSSSSSL